MTHSKTFPVTHDFFFRETEKSFRETSGKGPDEKNYCIIGFPGNSQEFPGNPFWFPGKFSTNPRLPGGRLLGLGGLGAPKGVQTDRKQFGAAEKLRILGYGCQGYGVRRAGLGLIVNSARAQVCVVAAPYTGLDFQTFNC